MMSLSDITHSKAYKNFMAKLYGWGASVVILGALFKLQHYPGASIMLIVGLGVEAVIFFFSAFEPLHELIDWTLVYPELSHMEEEEEKDKDKEKPKGTITEQLDRMLEEAKIGPELLESLRAGMRNLSDNASKLTDLTDASVATGEYTENVKQASESISSFKEASSQGSQVMQEFAGASANIKDNLSNVASAADQYSDSMIGATSSMKGAASSIDEMKSSYSKAVGALDEISSISGATRSYNEQVEKITNNLSSLNSMYELDLMESNKKLVDTVNKLATTSEELSVTSEATKPFSEQMRKLTESISSLNSSYSNEMEESSQRTSTVKEFYGGIEEMMKTLHESAEGAKRYKEEISQLGENLAALNNIYGNMLTAMNVGAEK
ncbi:MAG: gliding motility protein GldL [Bacteroidota bacterium]